MDGLAPPHWVQLISDGLSLSSSTSRNAEKFPERRLHGPQPSAASLLVFPWYLGACGKAGLVAMGGATFSEDV